MNRYEIYCTTEQSAKAIKLGAPILTDTQEIKFAGINGLPFDVDRVVIPTASQMIGWLEEHVSIISIEVTELEGYWQGYVATTNHKDAISKNGYESRQDAILAAIDAALNYLTKSEK